MRIAPQKLTTALVLLSIPLVAATFGPPAPFNFYANARRRAATNTEKTSIVRLPIGCAGFYVQNEDNLPLLVTAKHCLLDKPLEWCASGSVFSTESGESATCSEILAWDEHLDIVLIKMDHHVQGISNWSLFTGLPPVSTPLQVIGYPADKYALAGVNVTENCWIKKSSTLSPYQDTLDTSASYNCSIYGGNSGGPVLVQGTSIAIGMPYTYKNKDKYPNTWDDNQAISDDSDYDSVALFHDFALKFKDKLRDLKISTTDKTPNAGIHGDYLAEGKCVSDETKPKTISIIPEYMTGSSMRRLWIRFSKSSQKELACDDTGVCKNTDSTEVIQVISSHEFVYTHATAPNIHFSCPN